MVTCGCALSCMMSVSERLGVDDDLDAGGAVVGSRCDRRLDVARLHEGLGGGDVARLGHVEGLAVDEPAPAFPTTATFVVSEAVFFARNPPTTMPARIDEQQDARRDEERLAAQTHLDLALGDEPDALHEAGGGGPERRRPAGWIGDAVAVVTG